MTLDRAVRATPQEPEATGLPPRADALAMFENFDRPDGAALSPEEVEGVIGFVRAYPFQYTLAEIGAEFGLDTEDVRQILRNSGEYLSAIPLQDGVRHVWGHSDEAQKEWEYMRRRAGCMVSILLSINARMGRVVGKFGAPPTADATATAALVLDLFLALPLSVLEGDA